MRKNNLMFAICIVLVGGFSAKASYAQQTPKQVKLYTDSVEVVELTGSAEKCSQQADGTTAHLRVKSEKPVDVAVFFHIPQTGWTGKEFLKKSKGDEISHYACIPMKQVEWRIFARESGSQQPWPNPSKPGSKPAK